MAASAAVGDAGTESPHTVGDAASVVSGMRHGFKLCYQDQLRRDLRAAGKVRVKLRIGCDGSVVSVHATEEGIDEATVNCMVDVIRVARFDPPVGGFAWIAVPVTFVTQMDR